MTTHRRSDVAVEVAVLSRDTVASPSGCLIPLALWARRGPLGLGSLRCLSLSSKIALFDSKGPGMSTRNG